MTVQALPGSTLEVIESEFFLQLMVSLLANPSRLDGGGQSALATSQARRRRPRTQALWIVNAAHRVHRKQLRLRRQQAACQPGDSARPRLCGQAPAPHTR